MKHKKNIPAVISILNNKGGTGKTTTAVNLAVSLARKGKRVLVIDMDPQSNATSKLLQDGARFKDSLYEILEGEEAEYECLVYRSASGVYFVPNVPETAGLEFYLIKNIHKSLARLQTWLKENVQGKFDYILIDCPPNMGSFVLMSLLASEFVIVPVKAGSIDSVEGLVKAIKLIQQVKKEHRSDLKFLRVLINLVDRRTRVARLGIAGIRSTFREDQVFDTEIPINTAFEQAELLRSDIFTTNPSSTGARAFRLLADEVIQLLEKQEG